MFLTDLNAEIVASVYTIIQKIAPQAESGKYFQIWFSPDLGEKWRRSEHAHASYPGLLLDCSPFAWFQTVKD